MKAVLTRDNDYFIELTQRFKIARDNKADLFVSIHADSYTSDDAKGSSVWGAVAARQDQRSGTLSGRS